MMCTIHYPRIHCITPQMRMGVSCHHMYHLHGPMIVLMVPCIQHPRRDTARALGPCLGQDVFLHLCIQWSHRQVLTDTRCQRLMILDTTKLGPLLPTDRHPIIRLIAETTTQAMIQVVPRIDAKAKNAVDLPIIKTISHVLLPADEQESSRINDARI